MGVGETPAPRCIVPKVSIISRRGDSRRAQGLGLAVVPAQPIPVGKSATLAQRPRQGGGRRQLFRRRVTFREQRADPRPRHVAAIPPSVIGGQVLEIRQPLFDRLDPETELPEVALDHTAQELSVCDQHPIVCCYRQIDAPVEIA